MVKRIILVGLSFFIQESIQAQIGVGTNTPDESSALEIYSSSKGILFPRMSETQRDNIINPSKGLLIFNLSLDCLQINSGTPSAPEWICIAGDSEPAIPVIPSGSAIFSPTPPVKILSTSDVATLMSSPLNYEDNSGTDSESSSNLFLIPLVDIPGTIDNTTPLTVQLPYTSGTGDYAAFTGAYTSNRAGTGEGGDMNSFRLTYPAGTFNTSGTIEATIEVDGDGIFNAKQQSFNIVDTIVVLDFDINGSNAGSISLVITGGIPDKNFSDAEHKFIYTSVTAADGNEWLNNNLGANYANMNHSNFAPTQKATSYTDYHAYGSLFQWGRYSDGHELINYTSSSIGIPINSTTSSSVATDTPGHSLFINEQSSPYNWRDPQNDNLWQGETGINNPCPSGYRLPTENEINTLFTSENITNLTTGANSILGFTAPGNRTGSQPGVEGLFGEYWTSSVSGTTGRVRYLNSDDTYMMNYARMAGFSIRCIKD